MTSSPITDAARTRYLLDLLSQVPDPRKRRGRRHSLAGLLAVGIAAAGRGGWQIPRFGAQVGVRPDLALPYQRAADLQVERQPEDLDRNAAIGNTRFKRDRNLRQRTADRAERVVAAPPECEPLPLKPPSLKETCVCME
jgi:hypothetical protein